MPKIIEKNIENQFEAITILDIKDNHIGSNRHFNPDY